MDTRDICSPKRSNLDPTANDPVVIGSLRAHILLGRLASLFFVTLPAPVVAEPPVDVDVFLPRTELLVGEPLVIEMRVTNVSDEVLEPFGIASSEFSLTFYRGDIVEDCFVLIASVEPADPPPPRPPLFIFRWQLTEQLQPGESAICRITYPQTLHEGTETISLFSSIAGTFWLDLAEFTYTLKGEAPRSVSSLSATNLQLMAVLLLLSGWKVQQAQT